MITLTKPIKYPNSVEARITGIVIDLPQRLCEIHVQIGHMVNGRFQAFRTQPVQFKDDELSGTTGFKDLIQAVPEFKNLRKALETYLDNQNIFKGSVS